MHTVEFIPAEWVERSIWAAAHGEVLNVYSRPIQVERRVMDLPVVRDRRQPETVESIFEAIDLRQFCGSVE